MGFLALIAAAVEVTGTVVAALTANPDIGEAVSWTLKI
jgi:hypothetical protein